MNAALKFDLAQQAYDNRLPVDLDENPSVAEWLERNAGRLMDGETVAWGYKPSERGQVTAEQFYAAVQDHLVNRQIDGADQRDAFARLVVSSLVWGRMIDARDQALYLMGDKAALKNIAFTLLTPHAERAVELDRIWQMESEEAGF